MKVDSVKRYRARPARSAHRSLVGRPAISAPSCPSRDGSVLAAAVVCPFQAPVPDCQLGAGWLSLGSQVTPVCVLRQKHPNRSIWPSNFDSI